MGQSGAGDNQATIRTPDVKEQGNKGDVNSQGLSWPNVVKDLPESGQLRHAPMSPSDTATFGKGAVDANGLNFGAPDGEIQIIQPREWGNNGCQWVNGANAERVNQYQEAMAEAELGKSIGNRQPANAEEEKTANEITELAKRNAKSVDQSVIDGNERMRQIFSELTADATQNVIDTANRALQKDGYRFVRIEDGSIRLAEPTPSGQSPDIHIKEPDCNQS